MMLEKMQEVQAAYERLEMATDLLMSVIESTGQFTEGFYALRMLADHSKTLNRGTFMADAASPEEAMDQLLVQLQNMTATVQGQVERLDR